MALGLVVTANVLIEGDVVYLAADDGWTRDLAQALVLTDKARADTALARASVRSGEVVGCYLAAMHMTGYGPEPAHFREDFRRTGPSNYPHGKQSATAPAERTRHVSL